MYVKLIYILCTPTGPAQDTPTFNPGLRLAGWLLGVFCTVFVVFVSIIACITHVITFNDCLIIAKHTNTYTHGDLQ